MNLTYVLLLIICLLASCEAGFGRWVKQGINANITTEFKSLGFSPVGEKTVIISIKSCETHIMTFRGLGTDEFFIVYFDYPVGDKVMTLLIPASMCTDDQCKISSGRYGPHLNCSEEMFFWAYWTNRGSFFVGTGDRISSTTIVLYHKDEADTFEVRTADIFPEAQSGVFGIYLDGWSRFNADKDVVEPTYDYGYSAIGKQHLVFSVRGCENVVVKFLHNSTEESFINVLLGYSNNTMTVLVSNSRCNETGSCNSMVNTAPRLDCQNDKVFWATWSNKGDFSLGEGLAVGLDPFIVSYKPEDEFEIRLIRMIARVDMVTLGIHFDEDPVFNAYSWVEVEVEESRSVGSTVYALNVTDKEDAYIVLDLEGEGVSTFSIYQNYSMGIMDIITKDDLDYEQTRSYVLTVRCDDTSNSVRNALTIRVTNVVDEVPQIEIFGNLTMVEELPTGTTVSLPIVVQDTDINDTLTYSLSGNHSDYFNINADTGVITLDKRVDYDGVAGVHVLDQLVLNVIDSGGLGSNISLSIEILDENDNQPVCAQTMFYTELPENSTAGTVLANLSCTDADSDSNGNLEISIVDAENADNKFTVQDQAIYVDGSLLDYELSSDLDYILYLAILVTDTPDVVTHTLSTTVALVVKVLPVNEHTPEWIYPSVDVNNMFPDVNITENTKPGSAVLQLNATDKDTGVDGVITYTIDSVSGPSGTTVDSPFIIDSYQGTVTVVGLLDRDVATSGIEYYDVTVKAQDAGNVSLSAVGTVRVNIVNVNDNEPQFNVYHYEIGVAEDKAVNSSLYTLSAFDNDGDDISYSVVGNWSTMFQCVGSDVKLLQALDYETVHCHTITISATDGDYVTYSTLTIHVENVLDEKSIVEILNPINIPEELAIGTILDNIYTVTNLEVENTLFYFLTGLDTSYIGISVLTGELFIKKTVDYDGSDGRKFLDDISLTIYEHNNKTVFNSFINISLVDVNDNSPRFSHDIYWVNVTAENTIADTVLLKLECSDLDSGNNGRLNFTLIEGDDMTPKFKLVGNELQTTSTPIDYELLENTGYMYTLVVKAEDTPDEEPSNIGTAIIMVKVSPVNEYIPVWQSPDITGSQFITITVPEDTLPGTNISQLMATDDDLGKDGDVEYYLTAVTSNDGSAADNIFSLNEQSGELCVISHLDRDIETGGVVLYTLLLEARDKGSTSRTTSATMTVNIGNVNDNPPVFVNVLTSVDVQEDIGVGYVVQNITTSDIDGDDVSLSLVDGDARFFSINSSQLTLSTALDHESQSCLYIVIGASDGKFTTNATMLIYVTDVVDETPVITTLDPLVIPEELPVGSVLSGLFIVTDKDKTDEHTFSLTGSDVTYVSINSSTGLLTMEKRIDFDIHHVTNLNDLVLTVVDAGGLSATTRLNITMADTNDNSPVFSSDVYYVDVIENEASALQTLLEFNCSDIDSGKNGQIVFDIVSNPGSLFSIDSSSLKVNASTVDYESELWQYTVTVAAADQADYWDRRTSFVQVVVNVYPRNEYSPVWNSPSINSSGMFDSITVLETTLPGSNITVFAATDDDIGHDGDIYYSITEQVSDDGSIVDGVFAIYEDTGVLFAVVSLDADECTGGVKYYDLTITAMDRGSPPFSCRGKIRIFLEAVNDNPPVISTDYVTFSVSENTTVGIIVFKLDVTDCDGDDIDTVVVSGDDDYFSTTGLHVNLMKKLDYESQTYHFILISVSDGQHTITTPITIEVLDVIDELPVISLSSSLQISEELPIGYVIGGVFQVTDLDRDDTLSYSISGLQSRYFSINATTGIVSVKERIDYDSPSNLTQIDQMSITVVDLAGNSATENLNLNIVDINDNAPQFMSATETVQLQEHSTSNVTLLELMATDADAGVNGEMTMSIIAGDDSQNKFGIINNTLYAMRAEDIDYELMNDTYYSSFLTIQVKDSPATGLPLFSNIILVVQVLPKNDYSPTWQTPMIDTNLRFPDENVSESAALNTSINFYIANDGDHGMDGFVFYYLKTILSETGVNAMGVFAIHSDSGQLTTAKFLDSDLTTGGTSYFDITIVASDQGKPARTVEGTVRVHLIPDNDNSPVIDRLPLEISVFENVSVGDVIHELVVDDVDDDAVSLTLKDGDSHLFSIQGEKLTTAAKLDFETKRCHTFIVSANDGKHEVNTSIRISVLDVIDESPIIHINKPLSINEELALDSIISVFSVTDDDQRDVLMYVLTGSNSNYFSIDSSTGQMRINKRIDYDPDTNLHVLDDVVLHVTDLAGLTATAVLNFTVLDINDHSPQFEHSLYVVNVTEHSNHGVPLVTFNISDNDSRRNADFVVSITNTGTCDMQFRIDGLTLVANTSTLDYETMESSWFQCFLSVDAVDQADTQRTGQTVVIIQILPSNEFIPEWRNNVPDGNGFFEDITVNENVSVGTVVYTLTATDGDLTEHGNVHYYIQGINPDDGFMTSEIIFNLDVLTGVIKTQTALDCDSATGGTQFYYLHLYAQDGSNTQNYTQGTLRINIENVNDNAPYFYSLQDTLYLNESLAIGHTLLTMDVRDDDNDNVTVEILTTQSLFQINRMDLELIGNLDFETESCHMLQLSATDGDHVVNASIIVHVVDINDEFPSIYHTPAFHVVEELAVGTALTGLFTAFDQDQGDVLTYTLTGGDSSYLTINSSTGEVLLSKRIDRDLPSSVSVLDNLNLSVTDSAGHMTSVMLNISIDDVNDNAPVCSQPVLEVNVTEQTSNGSVLELHCTDKDFGQNGQFNLTLDVSDELIGMFQLAGFQLQVDGSKVDYEVFGDVQYVLRVLAVDTPDGGKANTAVTVVLVHILPFNEYAPVWTYPSNVTGGKFSTINVLESTEPGSNLITFHAVDDDAGLDGVVTYHLDSVTDSDGNYVVETFHVDLETGILRTLQTLDKDASTGGVDYYDLVIKASDQGSPPKTNLATLRITLEDVNDNQPYFERLVYVTSVDEDSPLTSIITFNADDKDGQSVTFDATGTDVIQMIGSTIKLGKSLDFESKRCHVANISATDGEHTANVAFILQVNDVSDEDPQIVLARPLSIPEELAVGSIVGGLYTATDKDFSDILQYSLTGADTSLIGINNQTGELIVKARIDYDEPNQKKVLNELTLCVTDRGGVTSRKTLNISVLDINDNAPTCTPRVQRVTVTENTAIDTKVASLNCTDADTGANGKFEIKIADGADNKFRIDGSDILVSGPIDFEQLSSRDYIYTLAIQSVDTPADGQALTGFAVVIVEIKSENEFTPVWVSPTVNTDGFFTTLYLDERLKIGSWIMQLNATDKDESRDGLVQYALVSAVSDSNENATEMFHIDKDSGAVHLANELDADAATGGVTYYNLTCIASDDGTPSNSISGQITIHLTNENDNIPFFIGSVTEFTVDESHSVGGVVFAISADDFDGDSLTYSVVGGDTDIFECSSNAIVLKKLVDYESEMCHTIVISVTDGKYSVNRTYTVSVIDVNEEVPRINISRHATVLEELPIGTVISGLFEVIDMDSGDTFSFSLTGDAAEYISIDTALGVLTIRERIDRDFPAEIVLLENLNLTVTDSVGNAASVLFDITIEDVNDNPPVFSQTLFKTHVTENSSNTQQILILMCSDKDSGTNGDFDINIVSGNEDNLFSINNRSLLVNASTIDYETMKNPTFTLVLAASDKGEDCESRTGHTAVYIDILPLNEFAPVWSSTLSTSSYFTDVTIRENITVSSMIDSYSATDDDEGVDGLVRYSITNVLKDDSTSVSDVFSIESESGILRTCARVDADTATRGTSYYDITITATDDGSPMKSVIGHQKVYVTEINDNQPQFDHSVYTAVVDCQTSLGSTLLTLTAADYDNIHTIKYMIEDESSSYFTVDSNSGSFVWNREGHVDGIQTQRVLITDGGSPEFTSTTVVVVMFEKCDVDVVTSVNEATTSAVDTTTTTRGPCVMTGGSSDSTETWAMIGLIITFGLLLTGLMGLFLRKIMCYGEHKGPVFNKVEPQAERPQEEEPSLYIEDLEPPSYEEAVQIRNLSDMIDPPIFGEPVKPKQDSVNSSIFGNPASPKSDTSSSKPDVKQKVRTNIVKTKLEDVYPDRYQETKPIKPKEAEKIIKMEDIQAAYKHDTTQSILEKRRPVFFGGTMTSDRAAHSWKK